MEKPKLKHIITDANELGRQKTNGFMIGSRIE